ncbi:uncharacterized protein FOMMEDRAFT_157823 [Fomitiporia mediterranea MF3/22]|uniref:uncharacterized protein n=1 Tax=Fomitiporia mediterranea (strain MF3/22) TaxID=694068 RepID=UPI0004408A3F|nr:uncharacterized protein FOMMEDRAFT_157823 [Fomitiporia mediterranea MF3/22]EJD00722.1 hypothetical protein FOMMEDRAFT_157823 [Fomitiporia mediterranea MF3/22]
MGQSPSLPTEYARLRFTSNSLRNTVIECDSLGLHYQLSTPLEGFKKARVTTFSRWDAQSQQYIPFADWERKWFGKGPKGRVRIYSKCQLAEDTDDRFVLTKYFFPRTWGGQDSPRFNRTFTANNGRQYVWKARDFSLKLYSKDEDVPIASYTGRRYFKNAHMPFIRLAPGCEDILDYLVVTCVIAERKRREAKKKS